MPIDAVIMGLMIIWIGYCRFGLGGERVDVDDTDDDTDDTANSECINEMEMRSGLTYIQTKRSTRVLEICLKAWEATGCQSTAAASRMSAPARKMKCICVYIFGCYTLSVWLSWLSSIPLIYCVPIKLCEPSKFKHITLARIHKKKKLSRFFFILIFGNGLGKHC